MKDESESGSKLGAAEESNLTYRTLFVEECMKPEMQEEKSPPKKSERLAIAAKHRNDVHKWILLPAIPLYVRVISYLLRLPNFLHHLSP